MKMLRSDWFRTFLIMVGGTIVNTYGLGWVHFENLPLSTFWWVIIARSCSSILSLIAIRIFCPNVFSRFGLGNKPKQLLISLGVVLFLMGPSLLQIDYRGVGSAQIFESFVFALFIGIDEDLFSRGFAFGVLERYGVWIAAILSSLQFGLLHLGNIVWGGQSAVYTIGQAISAGAFGFLAAALMVYSGTILVPILMHGLCDMPMQFQTSEQFTKQVTGNGDWVSVFADLVIYSAVGWILIVLSDPKRKERLMHWAGRFGLLDEKPSASTLN